MRLNPFLFVPVALLLALPLRAQCGVERWSIKTGTDSGASAINLGSYVSSTIYNMQQSVRPASIPSTTRVAPRETTQYQVSGTLIKYAKESDSDYHLVIKDSAGRTMIVEIPAPNCVGAGSPFGPGIANARRQFDARFTATTSFKTTSTAVTVRGVGFWDFLHGQTGVSPNGIELHSVLNITFPASLLATGVQSLPGDEPAADPSDDVHYPADVIGDEDGGRVRVYRGGAVLGDDALFHGGVVVEDPSVVIVFAGDRWDAAHRAAVQRAVRSMSADAGFRDLDRYGVRTFGLRVNAVQLPEAGRDLSELDVQRLLANAVEDGRIQHVDENAIYLVMLDPAMDASIASDRDWRSYHSEFHPTDLAMRYVVARGGLDEAALGDAIHASVYRALVNPAGNGWF
ncbi:MAG: hypothetical protein JO197_08410 [Acidobacteria bacterium]|nr:hypothetical protein [Acidobacteriota bacterium]MBV9474643.1 hypothetical protein [Acidobacteriota bacterium]